ncbi:hypothetical protein SD70_30265 [Gordoniibacillus kamchatkensis]|uniref:Uncharacterized protein n=1 Tax=Gordoniibacillus kamchatkensis TaxID=1590651 RepID=A0ABR5AB90_9BACL|nr:hypothetical protein [Paenibacillus sp. VKM B-2647]KIL37855.1 hypothetical protein SD70_30265 [Paenibacillus sp. VKM B-2647]
MYVTVPTYVQRQYAVNDGLYKIHAVARTKSIRQGSSQPLYDMFMRYLPAPAPAPSRVVPLRPAQEPVGEEESAHHAPPAEPEAERQAGRQTGQAPVPSPFGRSAYSRPYSPYGRFRDQGYNADYLPQRAASREEQQPWQLRYANMTGAYRVYAAI